jgi:L,D-peptidoglycan transpeptidase YkuD (ErfK/YbiS/YcfS/YnhG family)
MAGGMPSATLMPVLYDARIADWLSPGQPGQNAVMDLLVDSSGFAAWSSWRMRCALGRSGISARKHEGDGATPVGVFAMRRLLFRPDREPRPTTALPSAAIAPADGWCDAPGDRAYNRPVRLPYPASAEQLWRDDHLYDLLVVLGYNDDPVVSGQGSAIFLHLAAPDFAPTAGCVALQRDDFLTVIAAADPASRVIIAG